MADIRGYYAALGVEPGVPRAEIARAYRQQAKEWHPDKNSAPDASAKFKIISEAYSVLRDESKRAAYDAACAAADEEIQKKVVVEAVSCSRCKKVTAQPRYLIFWNVVAILYGGRASPVQGVFCAACARIAGWKATLVTSLFGWLGILGIAWTPWFGFRNAFGGQKPPDIESRLVWRNAMAFFSQGNVPLAAALAQRVIDLKGMYAQEAREFTDHLKSHGYTKNQTLRDPWKVHPAEVAARLVLMLIVPVGFVVWISKSSGPSVSPGPDTLLSTSPPIYAAADKPSAPSVPGCTSPPPNGAILSGDQPTAVQVHSLEVMNSGAAPAIVKVRNAETGLLLISFFVAKSASVKISSLQDGSYRIQYAFGQDLAEDCQNFQSIGGAGEFPLETLATQYETDKVVTQRLSYTLYTVVGGNVHPTSISTGSFNAP